MKFKWTFAAALAVFGAGSQVLLATAQTHQHEMMAPAPTQGDGWQLVQFPEPMRLHIITSMRDHLLALQEIDVALSKNEFDKAASIAEGRLGMSSLELHGAAHIAPYMRRVCRTSARKCTGRRAGSQSKPRTPV